MTQLENAVTASAASPDVVVLALQRVTEDLQAQQRYLSDTTCLNADLDRLNVIRNAIARLKPE